MITKMLLGAVLAGGRGRRMGGAKALAQLGGAPLLARPVTALSAVCAEVVVVAKPATELPPLGVEVVREPVEPSHPAAGIVAALRRGGGGAVLVAAGDLPFLERSSLEALIGAGGLAIACSAAAGPQPLLGVYPPEVGGVLAEAARAGAPLRATVLGLGARLVEVPERVLVNVNTPEQLAALQP
jgi:molybdopterin-guanine dinucleotide biosynthesis protein A